MCGFLKYVCSEHGSLCGSGFEKNIWSWGQGGIATKYVNVYVEERDDAT